MSGIVHQTRPIQVWVDVDLGIADAVIRLNQIPGVRTHTSCQGTIGEGGPHPYFAYVECSWTDEALPILKREFRVTERGKNWGTVRPWTKQ